MSAKEAEKVRESAGNGAKNVRFDTGVGADEGFLQIRPKKSANRPIRGAEKVRSAASEGPKLVQKSDLILGWALALAMAKASDAGGPSKLQKFGRKSPVGSSPKV